MKKIAIRVLGGKGIGYGHYYRCLSLAKAIRLLNEDIDVLFIINQELEKLMIDTNFEFIVCNDIKEDCKTIDNLNIDLFIFDSYLGNDEYLGNIKEKSKLMLVDDNNDIYDSTIPDIIYNGNIHAEKLGYPNIDGQLRLLGPKYLIMKEEYWDSDMDKGVEKDGILVTTGGTDEYGITLNILKKIKDLDIKIRIIIGLGYMDDYIKEIEDIKTGDVELIYKPSSLKSYISSSKMVITAGGSTVYEVLSQRSMLSVFSIADNQDLICKELNDMGVEYLGKYPNIEYSRLRESLEKLEEDCKFDEKIFDMVTGEGSKSVANEIIGN